MDFMLLLSSILLSMISSAILIAIVDINIKKFLKLKNIDVETHKIGMLINVEEDGKDKKEYDKYINHIYLIFIIIFTILFIYILSKIN